MWGQDAYNKSFVLGIISLQADMVFTEDPVETVIADTDEDLVQILATKMPRLRRGAAWEPQYK